MPGVRAGDGGSRTWGGRRAGPRAPSACTERPSQEAGRAAALQGRPLWRVTPLKTRFPESWQSTAQAAVSPFGEGPGSGGPPASPRSPSRCRPVLLPRSGFAAVAARSY